MSFRMLALGTGIAATVLAGCEKAAEQAPPEPAYQGYQALIIDDNLVNFLVTMTDPPTPERVSDYARCVAAGYGLRRGDGFARHIRTNLSEEAGIWRADAVYTFSPTLPAGLRTIDIEVATQNCNANGIPTE